MNETLQKLPLNASDVRPLVDGVFAEAVRQNASDVHVEPGDSGYEVRFRMDGLLEAVMRLPADVGRGAVTRLMVLAKLLTYRQDVPQEGRAAVNVGGREVELRISIMPTVQGLRAAVRLPTELAGPRTVDELGFSRSVTESLKRFTRAESGMLVVTGPAGSGKTTTLYALLSHLAAVSQGISIVSLEDPVERRVAGVTQIEVRPFGELTYEKALRSILRQDPQVLMLGEIRDAATAQLATQAAMTGHRLITTVHASTTSLAVSRLLDVGLEPYQVSSALWGVLAQRLVRRLQANSAEAPGRSSYRGRLAVGEFLAMDEGLRRAILSRPDAATIEAAARGQPGFTSLRRSAEELAGRGKTDAAEIARVFGDAVEPCGETSGGPHP